MLTGVRRNVMNKKNKKTTIGDIIHYILIGILIFFIINFVLGLYFLFTEEDQEYWFPYNNYFIELSV